jgi:predicted Zn finger-like uncharacterized protein
MKITCQACAAKYTIADEKVVGKVVKIRCKKCGASIVINGNDPSGASAGIADAQNLDYTEGGSQAWTVNVAEGDQRAMEDAEIVTAYRSGVVNDETYCWKDGMPDWLPLREIPLLYGACAAGHQAGPTDPPGDDMATKVQAPPAFLLGSSAPAAAPAQAAHTGQNGSGAHYPPGAPAPLARRAPGRAGAADLFGGASQAGGEDDVMTSAPAGMPQVHESRDVADKLTGARNENSVLFSLNALTSKGGVMPQKPMPASAEASGLIDIRQLSAQIGLGENRKESRIDDIMNLAGGGAFSPSLTAPVLSAPPIEDYAAPQTSLSPAIAAKNKKLLFLALGGGAFLVVAAIGVALLLMHRPEEASEGKEKPAASAVAETPSGSASAGAPAGSVAANDTPAPSASEGAQAAGPGAASGASQDQGSPAAPKDKETVAKAPAQHEAPRESAPARAKDTPAGVPAAVAAAAGGGASASDAPFNMGEAKSRLAATAAGVQSCKKGDATGTGRVIVVFAPNGTAQSATVTGPPFEGTPAGACVAARFRGVRVPAFGGSPFSVAKSFTIN